MKKLREAIYILVLLLRTCSSLAYSQEVITKEWRDGQTGHIMEAGWIVTRESFPAGIVLPNGGGAVFGQTREDGYYGYGIVTKDLVFLVASNRKLNITSGGIVVFKLDTKKARMYLRDDGGKKVKLDIVFKKVRP